MQQVRGCYEKGLGGKYPQGPEDYDERAAGEVSNELIDMIAWVVSHLGKRIIGDICVFQEGNLSFDAGRYPDNEPFYGGRAFVMVSNKSPVRHEPLIVVGSRVYQYEPGEPWENRIRDTLMRRTIRHNNRLLF